MKSRMWAWGVMMGVIAISWLVNGDNAKTVWDGVYYSSFPLLLHWWNNEGYEKARRMVHQLTA